MEENYFIENIFREKRRQLQQWRTDGYWSTVKRNYTLDASTKRCNVVTICTIIQEDQ